MEGYVSARHALVPLMMRGAKGQAEVDFVLDTGFAGFLTMALADINTLGLPYSHPTFAHLADGSRIVLDVYRAIILWDGEERDVEVLATGDERLLGTSLLDGYDVFIPFEDGGVITITRR